MAACVAVKLTNPCATSVINPLLSIVATDASLGEYVMAPALALVGANNAEKGAEPYVLFADTLNVERTGVPLITVMTTLPVPTAKFVVVD